MEGAKDRLILYYSDGIVEAERIKYFLEEGYQRWNYSKKVNLRKMNLQKKA